jgi:hypothetical protein
MIGTCWGTLGATRLAQRYFSRADAVARTDNNPQMLVAAGVSELSYYAGAAQWATMEKRAAELLPLAWDIGALGEWEAMQMIYCAAHLRHCGPGDVGARLSDVIELAEGRGNQLSAAWAQVVAAEHAWLDGAHERATTMATAAKDALVRGSGVAAGAVSDGLLSRIALDGGATERARTHALRGLSSTTNQPLLFVHESGTRYMAEVLLDLWERAIELGSSEASDLGHSAHTACRIQHRLGQQYLIAKPAGMRLRARLLFIRGKRKRAQALLDRALEQVRQLSMPLEEACILADQARLFATDPQARLAQLEQAQKLLTDGRYTRRL